MVADVTLIERDPYGAGWLVRVAPSAFEVERDALHDAHAYAAWLAPRLADKQTRPLDDQVDLSIDPLRGW